MKSPRLVKQVTLPFLLVAIAFLVACGSDDSGASPTATPTPAGGSETPVPPTPTPTPTPTAVSQGDIQARLETARARWRVEGPGSYEFDLTWSCFCVYEGNTTHITVKDGLLHSTTNPETGHPVGPDYSGPQMTVDGLFDWIQTGLDTDSGEVLTVDFERDFGYPISASIDWIVGAADDGVSFRINNFRAGQREYNSSQLKQQLDAARALWKENALEDYEFVFQWSCFCPPSVNAPVRVRVETGNIVSLRSVDSGDIFTPPSGIRYFTVLELFDWLDEQLAKEPDFAEISFDSENGHPVDARIDPLKMAFDEEQAFKITELKAMDRFADLQLELNEARQKWNATVKADYQFDFNWQCFCVDEYVAPVRVTVADGAVTDVIRREDGSPVAGHLFDGFVPVPALLQRIQDAIDGQSASVRAVFDPDSGLPTEVSIDIDERIADEEIGWNAGNLSFDS